MNPNRVIHTNMACELASNSHKKCDFMWHPGNPSLTFDSFVPPGKIHLCLCHCAALITIATPHGKLLWWEPWPSPCGNILAIKFDDQCSNWDWESDCPLCLWAHCLVVSSPVLNTDVSSPLQHYQHLQTAYICLCQSGLLGHKANVWKEEICESSDGSRALQH